MMKPNLIEIPFTQMTEYVAIYKKDGDSTDWGNYLNLDELELVTSIEVFDDADRRNVLAQAIWTWAPGIREIKFYKIEVDEDFQDNGIGTTIMKMVIAIAKFYGARRITGTVTGEKRNWEWYPKLGFTIFNGNKLLMELDQD